MVSLVETMRMTADGFQLTAYGPDKDEIRRGRNSEGNE